MWGGRVVAAGGRRLVYIRFVYARTGLARNARQEETRGYQEYRKAND